MAEPNRVTPLRISRMEGVIKGHRGASAEARSSGKLLSVALVHHFHLPDRHVSARQPRCDHAALAIEDRLIEVETVLG